MGDRGQIVVQFGEDGDIYYYAHNWGSSLPEIVAEALDSPEGRYNWDDSEYLARVLFEHLISHAYTDDKPTLYDKATGFSISPFSGDSENPDVYVNLPLKQVFYDEEAYTYATFIQAFLQRE